LETGWSRQGRGQDNVKMKKNNLIVLVRNQVSCLRVGQSFMRQKQQDLSIGRIRDEVSKTASKLLAQQS
jgi:hypothetical protein